jgi:hypothetical protein
MKVYFIEDKTYRIRAVFSIVSQVSVKIVLICIIRPFIIIFVLQAGLAPRTKPGARTPGVPFWLAHRVFKVGSEGSGSWRPDLL